MYKFKEPNEVSTEENTDIQFIYDGKVITQEVNGFEILNIFDREGSTIQVDSSPTDVGSISIGSRIVAEPILVEYRVRANTTAEFQRVYQEVMARVYKKEDVFFSFSDNPTVHFLGRFVTFGSVQARTNDYVGMMELYRSSPYKFTDERTKSTGSITDEMEIKPFSFEVEVTTGASGLSITNGNQAITLTDFVASGDVVVIDLVNGFVFKNGIDFTYALSLNSDFENFSLVYGDEIGGTGNVVSDVGNLTVIYRGVGL